MLEDDPGIEVVGEAANGDDAIRLAAELRPRVVVMDAAMPGTSGLAATRSILSSTSGVAVLMLSMHSEETLVRQAMDAGACGYILKNVVDLDLAAAIRLANRETHGVRHLVREHDRLAIDVAGRSPHRLNERSA